MQRSTPSIIQSWKTATPRGAAIADAAAQHFPGVAEVVTTVPYDAQHSAKVLGFVCPESKRNPGIYSVAGIWGRCTGSGAGRASGQVAGDGKPVHS